MAKKQVYKYVGKGEGVPGLPHEVTVAQAEERGLTDVLDACIKKEVYKLKPATKAGKGKEV